MTTPRRTIEIIEVKEEVMKISKFVILVYEVFI
jgi:hypothetical protein